MAVINKVLRRAIVSSKTGSAGHSSWGSTPYYPTPIIPITNPLSDIPGIVRWIKGDGGAYNTTYLTEARTNDGAANSIPNFATNFHSAKGFYGIQGYPQYSPVLDISENALVFDGSAMLENKNYAFAHTEDITVALAYNATDDHNFYQEADFAFTARFGLRHMADGLQVQNKDEYIVFTGLPTAYGVNRIMLFTCNNTTREMNVYQFKNNKLYAADNNPQYFTKSWSTVPLTKFVLGGYFYGAGTTNNYINSQLDGTVYEVIQSTKLLNTLELSSVAKYLAIKWGIFNNGYEIVTPNPDLSSSWYMDYPAATQEVSTDQGPVGWHFTKGWLRWEFNPNGDTNGPVYINTTKPVTKCRITTQTDNGDNTLATADIVITPMNAAGAETYQIRIPSPGRNNIIVNEYNITVPGGATTFRVDGLGDATQDRLLFQDLIIEVAI